MSQRSAKTSGTPVVPIAHPYVAIVLAWLVPGLGHVFLGRRGRGLAYFVIVLTSLVVGCLLDGRLLWEFSGSPLLILATLGGMGSGLPYLLLGWTGYQGDVQAAGFEYGGAFILTSGLMNLLLVLDAWDIAWGKELAAATDTVAETEGDSASSGEISAP